MLTARKWCHKRLIQDNKNILFAFASCVWRSVALFWGREGFESWFVGANEELESSLSKLNLESSLESTLNDEVPVS